MPKRSYSPETSYILEGYSNGEVDPFLEIESLPKRPITPTFLSKKT